MLCKIHFWIGTTVLYPGRPVQYRTIPVSIFNTVCMCVPTLLVYFSLFCFTLVICCAVYLIYSEFIYLCFAARVQCVCVDLYIVYWTSNTLCAKYIIQNRCVLIIIHTCEHLYLERACARIYVLSKLVLFRRWMGKMLECTWGMWNLMMTLRPYAVCFSSNFSAVDSYHLSHFHQSLWIW